VPVIAPGSVEECFYAGVQAVNWAERYQGPVIVLSEHMLSESNQNIRKPDLSKVKTERRITYNGNNGYHRYESWELSPMPVPGNPGAYVANGSEHDGMGDTTHLAERHIQMTERRFSKLKLLEEKGEHAFESANNGASIAIMPWGGTKGPAREAYNELTAAGMDIAWFYTMYLNPMPPELMEQLRKKDLVLVPELNYQGQMSGVLRMHGVKAKSITQYTGLPFKVSDLVKRITEQVQSHSKQGVTV
jgi:2-oxoglutarate ferredoxin oxidoreductase subunit alpha